MASDAKDVVPARVVDWAILDGEAPSRREAPFLVEAAGKHGELAILARGPVTEVVDHPKQAEVLRTVRRVRVRLLTRHSRPTFPHEVVSERGQRPKVRAQYAS